MSQDKSANIIVESPREFFCDRVETAFSKLKVKALPRSREYLVGLLEHYMISTNLFEKRETLAEMYLRAQNSPQPQRIDLLKKLGDSSLYISGFFGDSLTRKIVDIDYYMDMGGTAYGALASSASDENMAQVFGEFSVRFTEFVDVLTLISQGALIQSNEDLLKLYNRYMATGSRLAEGQLLEKGLLNSEVKKGKSTKM